MNTDLTAWIHQQIADFPAKVTVYAVDMNTGTPLLEIGQKTAAPSASTIKVPILLAATQLVEEGRYTWESEIPLPTASILPDSKVYEEGVTKASYPLWEFLYWMIVSSDNTATNVMIDLLGMEVINRLCQSWGATDTIVQRRMLDFESARAGRDNFTSPYDQYVFYAKLLQLAPTSPNWARALELLQCQRSKDGLLRYIPGNVALAGKPGGLDYLSHDAGVFLDGPNPYFLAIFTWDGPAAEGNNRQKRFLARLSHAIWENYTKQ